jgi:hypothetical protein
LILRSLAGELRDQGFAPTEIRRALFSALVTRN